MKPNPNRVALGTFPLANVFSEVTSEKAKAIIETFIDHGGYYIDTAPMYGFGDVEKYLGQVLKGYPRDKYFLATKCGWIGIENHSWDCLVKSSKYQDVINILENSLKLLQTDFIDLYFVHSPDPNTPFSETMKALNLLQKQGKIKYIGVSNVDLNQLKEFQKYGHIEYVQNRFSLINRSIDKPFADYLTKNHIKLTPYQPIERGQLSNQTISKTKPQSEDFRSGKPDWKPQPLNTITSWVKKYLHPIAKELNITIDQLAIAWTLHQPYIDFTLVGSTNVDQVKINLQADRVKLPPKTLTQIDQAYKILEKQIQEQFGQSIREFRGLNEKYY